MDLLENQLLSELHRKWCCIKINFKLSSGYGTEFFNQKLIRLREPIQREDSSECTILWL